MWREIERKCREFEDGENERMGRERMRGPGEMFESENK